MNKPVISYSLLLLSNPFQFREYDSYLPLGIRVMTCAKWNHAAILELRDGVPYRVIEANQKGVVATLWDAWWDTKDRLVWEREILIDLDPNNIAFVLHLVGEAGYGLLDLPQLAKYIVLSQWLGRDYEWDGIAGTGLLKGVFCSELVSILFGDEDAHLRFPAFYAHPHDSRLSPGRRYRTRPGQPHLRPFPEPLTL